MFINSDLENIVTPVKVDVLERLLKQSNYDTQETEYLVNGFRNGFDIHYDGPKDRKDYSENIPFRSVGTAKELWDKLMKEVKLRRYAGPFKHLPFEHFVQSPIGLVPKAGGKTRLIFHLSYNFPCSGEASINAHTDKRHCRVKYRDLDEAVRIGLQLLGKDKNKHGKKIFCSKSDLSAAFRMVPLAGNCWKYLVMRAKNPEMPGDWFYFVDKCLPFGHSISCAIFQWFSNALKHLLEFVTGTKDCVVNYLDDFLFLATSESECNYLAKSFVKLCGELGVPIAEEKTELADTRVVFLGILLDGESQILSIPEEKRARAVELLKIFGEKRKATVKDLQRLAGYLNFLNQAIVPGRTFTRRMYAKFNSKCEDLKSYHHVKLDAEFKADCQTWLEFLTCDDQNNLSKTVCRPWLDISINKQAPELDFYTDSSASLSSGGMGGVFGEEWFKAQWNREFIKTCKPSIAYLELFALVTAVLIWKRKLANTRFTMFCDNQAVVEMVNNLTSSCKNCMILLRILVKLSLKENFRIFVKYVPTLENGRADALLRDDLDRFVRICHTLGIKPNPMSAKLPSEIWPPQQIWLRS